MIIREMLRGAGKQYPDFDIFIPWDILSVNGMPGEECIRKSLSSHYFLPVEDFINPYP